MLVQFPSICLCQTVLSTPLDLNVKVTLPAEGDPCIVGDELRCEYLAGVGHRYLTIATWPDLVYTVQHLSQLSQRPTAQHMSVLKWTFCYLHGTLQLLVFPSTRMANF